MKLSRRSFMKANAIAAAAAAAGIGAPSTRKQWLANKKVLMGQSPLPFLWYRLVESKWSHRGQPR